MAGMGRLDGRTALVTGGAAGIGQAVAVALAREGADLLIQHTAPEEAQEAHKAALEIERLGRRAVVVQADVSTPDGAYAVMEAAVTAYENVDVLVNNAGLRPTLPFEESGVELFDAVMAASVRSVFLMTRLVLPLMVARDYGRIVSTVSDAVYSGAPGLTLYGAASGAILGFTRSLSHDIGPRNVTANCVAPGALAPRQSGGTLAAGLDSLRRRLPRQRLGDLEDVTPAYVFLASPDARHMVGQCLSPSGGAVML